MVNVLAVGAHPDDIELGCSGTLLRHKKEGGKVYLLILTKGEASGNKEVREKECIKSANLMGADEIIFGNIEDTKINDDINTIMIIERVINQVDPDLIYTHSYKDSHQDHRNTGYATLSAGRRCNKILLYESPTTFRDFSPQLFVDITEYVEKKMKILRTFSSQSKKGWWAMGNKAVTAVEGLAAYRGFQAGVKVAEAFEVGRFVLNKKERILKNL